MSTTSDQSDELLEAFHAQQKVKKIQAAYQQNISKSLILREKPSQERMDSLAFLHRSDIQTGKMLGEGSYAQVFEVKSIDMSSTFCESSSRSQSLVQQLNEKAKQGQLVLKQIRPDVEDVIDVAADLATEAAFLMRLSHEHLVSLRAVPADFIQAFRDSDDGFFLLLDRVETTIEDELHVWSKSKRKMPSVAQRADYARQLASVLGYLHEHGIVYRDLKPDNVGLCTSTHKIQLFDFGLTRQLPSAYCDMEGVYKMSRAGTPRYMAPEVAMKGKYNTQADVYGWAVLLWEMMALKRAYKGYSRRELCTKVFLDQERPSLKSVPNADIQSILSEAWQDEPSERPNMAGLVEQLSTVQDAKPSRPFGFLRRRSSALPSVPPRNAVTATTA